MVKASGGAKTVPQIFFKEVGVIVFVSVVSGEVFSLDVFSPNQ